MRKLLLASLNYTSEGNHFALTRLVVVTDEDRKSGLKDPQIATRKAEQWFIRTHGNSPDNGVENILLDSVVAYDAIDEPLVFVYETENVFDASWNRSDVLPNESGLLTGFSDDVLIDVDGKRKTFVKGWYNHDIKQWRSGDEGFKGVVKSEIKWQYLPLAKYDKL